MSVKVQLVKTYEPYVATLPKDLQDQAMKVLNKVKPTVDLNDRILYSDGTLGSNITDLLLFHFRLVAARPPDYPKFEQKLEDSVSKWAQIV